MEVSVPDSLPELQISLPTLVGIERSCQRTLTCRGATGKDQRLSDNHMNGKSQDLCYPLGMPGYVEDDCPGIPNREQALFSLRAA